MTLLTLPAPDGTSFAVNPHRVSSVRPYFVVENGLRIEASVVWIDERHVHVCAHQVEPTIALIKDARETDFHAFIGGYVAAFNAGDSLGGAHMQEAWEAYVESGGDTLLPWRKAKGRP